MQAFDTFKVVPPGIGIVHQVNLGISPRACCTTARASTTRHPRGHRLAHDDDQRHRHRGLGRGRHRGRGGHAGPAGSFPHAGCRGRLSHGRAARGRHRDRPRAHRHADAAQGEGRRKIRRILRSRRPACRRRPRDHRQHGAWNTARRWASSRSTPNARTTSAPPAATRALQARRGLLQGAGLWGIPRPAAASIHSPRWRSTSAPSVPCVVRSEARRRIASSCPAEESSPTFAKPVTETGFGKAQARPKSSARPTSKTPLPMAPCSSPPSRAARTPPTRASCSPPVCSRKRR